MAQPLQLRAKLEMIVNFAIEDDAPFAFILEDRLVTALQVNDLQASRAARERFGRKRALLIGAAMVQRGHRLVDASFGGFSVFMGEAGNSAQALRLSTEPNSIRTCSDREIPSCRDWLVPRASNPFAEAYPRQS